MDNRLHELTNCSRGHIVPRYQTYGSCPICKSEKEALQARQRDEAKRKRTEQQARKKNSKGAATRGKKTKPKQTQSKTELNFKAGVFGLIAGFIFFAGYLKTDASLAGILAFAVAAFFAKFYRQIIGLTVAAIALLVLARMQNREDVPEAQDAVEAAALQHSSFIEKSQSQPDSRVGHLEGVRSGSTPKEATFSSSLIPSQTNEQKSSSPPPQQASKTVLPSPKPHGENEQPVRRPLDDRFFNPRVYTMLEKHGKVDGGFVAEKYEEEILSRSEVGAIAVERMEEQAHFLGIPRSEITAAMLNGDFTPYALDVILASEGIVDRSKMTDPNDSYALQGYSAAAWKKRYGALGDIDAPVHTIVDGTPQEMTGDDIAFRLVQKTMSPRRLRAMGLSASIELDALSAESAVRAIGGEMQRAFSERMNLMRNQSPVAYFDLHYHRERHYVRDSSEGFATYADYRQMRSERYVPRLRPAGFVTTSKVEANP